MPLGMGVGLGSGDFMLDGDASGDENAVGGGFCALLEELPGDGAKLGEDRAG